MAVYVRRTRLYSILNVAEEGNASRPTAQTPEQAQTASISARVGGQGRRIRVVCLKMSVRYFEADAADEDDHLQEELVGEICLIDDRDPLTKVRAELYRQLEPDRIPLKFHFVRSNRDGESERNLLWFETIPWHLEVTSTLADCAQKGASTLLLTAPVSITKPVEASGNESVDEVRAQWNREKQALVMEIRALEARLADAQHLEEFSPNSSLLKRALLALQREGFVTLGRNVDDLEAEYLKVFSRHDVESLFTANESNPFRFVWRRLADDPSAMRRYLESLQGVLVKHRVRKQRLSSKFWTRVLRDMRFVGDPGLFASWAEKTPWTLDEAERAAYLGSLVLADTFGLEEYLLMQDGVPNADGKTQRSLRNIPDAVNFESGRKKLETIAAAAERFHTQALERHESRRPSLEDGSSPSLFSRAKIPADHPCDHFQVDVLAAQFGICVCGFPRPVHRTSSFKQLQENDLSAKEKDEPSRRPIPIIPCKTFRLDLDALRYGTCMCGFSKEDHLASESCKEGSMSPGRLPTHRVQRHSTVPCDNYQVDVSAPMYGTCLCGHSKTAHSSVSLEALSSPINNLDEAEACVQGEEEMDDKNVTSKVRAQKAVRWVEGEISRLIRRMELLGKLNDATGNYEISFGELFARYQDISDTLVGILVRAKRRKIVEYHSGLGDMLLQGRHDAVKIVLLRDQADAWRRVHCGMTTTPYESKGDKVQGAC